MTTMQPIKRQTLTSAVTESLRQRILSGEFADGQQLRQEALSNEYGVSRVPVREALRQLEAEGLIQIIDHKGALVSKLSLEDVLELLEIRAMLEGSVLKAAIPCHTKADHDLAQQTLREFEQALRNNDVRHWGELNSRFHLALYRAAKRPNTLALIEQLHNKTDRYTRMQILFTRTMERAHEEHSKLLELSRQGKADEAAEFIRFHILSAGHALEDYLRNQSPQNALS
ncbi:MULTISPECIES: GntR family transcriptional regulator [Chromobacterium]|uniref:GntR family transcriptional regulator n=2 Tax=Chromobacterium TaxID=535 RepID=A0A1W0CAB7_9NEIS|nr:MULTISPECIES: GntR family transcriptional regulator [Chromobacterium]AXT47585.1 GntR family transcriptional regulator [Chromobacterium rhizoryzae]MBK0416653.1 GntR family transcriptional regulator [Chromobacterium haemolyticum]MBO0417848.1 GntR family transcriptional regulator [Chromobacterium haemolyticum]MBO0501054.1 GntR family transcriptional regulator [Chromobacterium haemolyticum]MDH0343033.1 GntR family transcriptional regulator [Chromobacterium haemolyticum]